MKTRLFLSFLSVTIVILFLSQIAKSELNCSGGFIGCLAIGTSLSSAGNSLNTIQGIRTVDGPQFAAIGFGKSPNSTIDIALNGNNTIVIESMLNTGVQAGDDVGIGFITQGSRNFVIGLQRSTGLFTLSPNSSTVLGGAGSLTLDALSGNVATGATVTVGITSTVGIATANLQFRGNSILKDGTPTCSGNGCVVLANSINSVGSVTTTATGSTDITITFSASFQHAPVCLADNATTGNLLRATQEAVGSFHLQGVTVAGDTLGYVCIGN